MMVTRLDWEEREHASELENVTESMVAPSVDDLSDLA